MTALDPISAVTAADPYPYYALLAADRPFYRDRVLGLWVAASAQSVEAVFLNDRMRTRPLHEPIPRPITGTPMAAVYSRLARMTDGEAQVAAKRVIVAALEHVDPFEIAAISRRCAAQLLQACPPGHPDCVPSLAFTLPALVIATLLGLSADAASESVRWTAAFVRSIAAGCSGDDIERGIPATSALDAALRERLPAPAPGTLLAALLGEARLRGVCEEVAIANAIGLLFQSYDASAGLIGNTLVALARMHSDLREACSRDPELLEAVVIEVARYDAPVQNTRRFVAREASICGARLRAGEAVLVVLASANRDPQANADPHRFDPSRSKPRTYTFGDGKHACPAACIAIAIASSGVQALVRAGIDTGAFEYTDYLPSVNVRIPTFAQPKASCEAAS